MNRRENFVENGDGFAELIFSRDKRGQEADGVVTGRDDKKAFFACGVGDCPAVGV